VNVALTDKVRAVGAAGLGSLVLVWLLGEVGVDMPVEVASAVTLLLSSAAGWFKRETRPARN
jgi:hypothetical protein